jgi:hypothetical protein
MTIGIGNEHTRRKPRVLLFPLQIPHDSFYLKLRFYLPLSSEQWNCAIVAVRFDFLQFVVDLINLRVAFHCSVCVWSVAPLIKQVSSLHPDISSFSSYHSALQVLRFVQGFFTLCKSRSLRPFYAQSFVIENGVLQVQCEESYMTMQTTSLSL